MGVRKINVDAIIRDHWGSQVGRCTRRAYRAITLKKFWRTNVPVTRYKPSEIAASALYLSNRIRKIAPAWTGVLVSITNLDEVAFVKPLAKEIFEIIPGIKNKSLFKKYSMDKFHAVAPTIPNH